MRESEVHRFTVPIYYSRVILTFTDDVDAIHKKHDLDVVGDPIAGVFEAGDDFHIYFEWDSTRPAIVAHECKHLVNKIFERIGHQISTWSDEPECYLLTYLVDKVYVLLNKPLPIPKKPNE